MKTGTLSGFSRLGLKMPKGTSKTQRMRKVACPECGYPAYLTRAWMAQGLPVCPTDGIALEPVALEDRLLVATPEEAERLLQGVSAAEKRRLGMDAYIEEAKTLKGRATQAKRREELQRTPGRVHCDVPSCGSFAVAGSSVCRLHGEGPSDDLPF